MFSVNLNICVILLPLYKVSHAREMSHSSLGKAITLILVFIKIDDSFNCVFYIMCKVTLNKTNSHALC